MKKKILVVGGGFGGVEAAISLKKEGFNEVTLVSDKKYMFIYPISIWIPFREIGFEDATISLEDLSRIHGFDLIVDEVEQIQGNERKVLCKGREIDGFDYLIIAVGAQKMRPHGVENTLSICGKPEESLKMREKIDELVKKGRGKIAMGFGGNPKDSSAVRGGPAFEVIFNLHNYLKKKGIRESFELTFFAPMEKPGARMGPKALEMMDLFFKKLDIKKHFGKKIERFEKNGIVFEDGSRLDSDFTMFIPANRGHRIFEKSDLPLTEAGFVKIDDFCEVKGFNNIYAIGDSAYIEGPSWRAKQGHIAEVMARNTAHNIAVCEGLKSGAKRGYKEHLNILCVMDSGNGAAFVYRNDRRGVMIPMPLVGHWLKKIWGWYFKNSKLAKIPRIPGL